MNDIEKKTADVPRDVGGFTMFVLAEIWRQKKWILLPLWILLAAFALIVLFGGSTLLPVIYIAF